MNRNELFAKVQAVIARLRKFLATLAKPRRAQKAADESDIPRRRVARLEPRRLPPMRGD